MAFEVGAGTAGRQGQPQAPKASGDRWACPDFPGRSARVLASLSTNHVATASDSASLKLGSLLSNTEAAMGTAGSPEHPVPRALRHGAGRLSVTSILPPPSTLKYAGWHSPDPTPRSEVPKIVTCVFVCSCFFTEDLLSANLERGLVNAVGHGVSYSSSPGKQVNRPLQFNELSTLMQVDIQGTVGAGGRGP